MGMLGGGRPNIPFETHVARLSAGLQPALLELRQFVRSLGPSVLEDVRPHRIVYSKTMNFRIFLDVEPAGDSIVLSVRFGRAGPPESLVVRDAHDLDLAKAKISEAYQKVQ